MANDLAQPRGWLHTGLRWHTLVFVLFNLFLQMAQTVGNRKDSNGQS